MLDKTLKSTKFWALVSAGVAAVGAAATGHETWPEAIGQIVQAACVFIAARGIQDAAERHGKHAKRD